MALETIQRKRFGLRLVAEVRRFASDGSGAAAIEYVLVGALIGVALVAGLSAVSGALSDVLGTLSAEFGG